MTTIATKALAETLNVSEPIRDKKNQTWFSFTQGREHGQLQIVLNRKATIAPFGLSTYNERQTLTLAIGQEMTDLREFFDVLDKKVREHTWEYRTQLFRTPPTSQEALAALQKPCIRPGKEGMPDTLQLKVDAHSSFYSLNPRVAVEPSEVQKGSQIVCIASPARVWCMGNGEFGVSLKLLHALVGERPKDDPEKLFEDCSFE